MNRKRLIGTLIISLLTSTMISFSAFAFETLEMFCQSPAELHNAITFDQSMAASGAAAGTVCAVTSGEIAGGAIVGTAISVTSGGDLEAGNITAGTGSMKADNIKADNITAGSRLEPRIDIKTENGSVRIQKDYSIIDTAYGMSTGDLKMEGGTVGGSLTLGNQTGCLHQAGPINAKANPVVDTTSQISAEGDTRIVSNSPVELCQTFYLP